MRAFQALWIVVYAVVCFALLNMSCVRGLAIQRGDQVHGLMPGCSVLDCGAFGGGIEDDTAAFRLCWEACNIVTVPAGEYLVAGLDLSGSDKHLRLLDGARLVAPGPDSRNKYAFLALQFLHLCHLLSLHIAHDMDLCTWRYASLHWSSGDSSCSHIRPFSS
jgi:hypothetical protein